jgi:hypothetical protein
MGGRLRLGRTCTATDSRRIDQIVIFVQIFLVLFFYTITAKAKHLFAANSKHLEENEQNTSSNSIRSITCIEDRPRRLRGLHRHHRLRWTCEQI